MWPPVLMVLNTSSPSAKHTKKKGDVGCDRNIADRISEEWRSNIHRPIEHTHAHPLGEHTPSQTDLQSP